MTQPRWRTSVLPAYYDALLTDLAEASWPVDVRVFDDYPAEDELPYNFVVVGDTWPDIETGDSDHASSWGPFGRGRRSEQFRMSVILGATAPGGTPKQARDTAFQIYGELEHVIRGAYSLGANGEWRPGLGVTGVTEAELQRGPHLQADIEDGTVCVIYCTIEVKASLERLV